jgi:hypothetical protein
MVSSRQFLLILIIVLVSSFCAASAAVAISDADQTCFGCHEQGMQMKFGNGEEISLSVKASDIEGSVHRILGCTACHGFTAENHPHRTFKSKQEYSSLTARLCTKCHTMKENKVHELLLSQSSVKTACTECHGSHAVKRVRDMPKGNQYCLSCHSREMTISFVNGEKHLMVVHEQHLNNSVHKNLSCIDCHFGFSSSAHPVRTFKSARDFVLAQSESCRRCHFDKYTKTLEGIHFKVLLQGNTKAPVCTDCHGTHAIASARKDKLANAHRCEQCHSEIYGIYAKSVHGAALIQEHIEDVPVCSDCHKAHDNAGPMSGDFRITIPQICASCHAKPEIMKKYNLSTDVVDTYLGDFHGVTLKFYKQLGQSQKQIAVCIDCHGIHDISKLSGSTSPVIKENLVKRCQKCHAGATANFPDSWISHYKPNFKQAPMVFLVNLMYKIFIPFMIIGLLLQIVLHMWRYIVNR